MVCSRRAPMFSVRWLTSAAIRAISAIASASTRASRPRSRAAPRTGGSARSPARSGCARSRRAASGSSSTRIGKRPCSSGIRSLGLATWNAPAAMNSTWSVLHRAVLGRHRRALDDRQQVALHALARDVGAVRARACVAILSISSMKTMPAFSARRTASRVAASCRSACRPPPRSARATPAGTFSFWRLVLRPNEPSMSLRPDSAISSMPGWPPSTDISGFDVVGELDLDLAIVELAVAQHRAQLLARRVVGAAAAAARPGDR